VERFPEERIRKSGNQKSTNLLQPADIAAPKHSWTALFSMFFLFKENI
jgi:hypothetical protein